MTPSTRPCQGVNAAGQPCGSPFVGQDGWCDAHRPGGREAMRERQRKGAEAAARRFRGGGLDPEEFGPLRTPQDAERWLEVTALAVAARKLTHSEGRTISGAVREWLRAHDAGRMAEETAELQRQVDFLQGKKPRHLKVVKEEADGVE